MSDPVPSSSLPISDARLRQIGWIVLAIAMLLGRFVQDPAFPTVTIYNHLDVQPADAADGWRTPPFAMTSAGKIDRAALPSPRGSGDEIAAPVTPLDHAAHAIAALEQIERNPPDLVISDIMMPRMD